MSIPARTRATLNLLRERSAAVRRVELPVQQFIHTEGRSSWVLLAATVVALLWANSPFQSSYFRLWEAEISFNLGLVHFSKTLHHWINDGLMAIFFFLVGMEIKGELVTGHLRERRQAMLPVVAALGGMIVPALIYVAFNAGGPGMRGWGIPMATDIAFALGVLAMAKGIPPELKVFLLALAIVDDIGAILVIAVFYTEALHLWPIALAVVLIIGIWGLRRAAVQLDFPYILLGILFWVATLESGIHATIAGVILGLMVPTSAMVDAKTFAELAPRAMERLKVATQTEDEPEVNAQLGLIEGLASFTEAPIQRLTRKLHTWVAFLILPLFALCNAGVSITSNSIRAAANSPVAWGITAGLLLGKPLGIFGFTWLAAKTGLTELPVSVSQRHLAGVSVLAGIGFTVSIFIATLGLDSTEMINAGKIAVLSASCLAGIVGFVWLRTLHSPPTNRL